MVMYLVAAVNTKKLPCIIRKVQLRTKYRKRKRRMRWSKKPAFFGLGFYCA